MFQFVNIDKTKNLIDIRLKNNFNQFGITLNESHIFIDDIKTNKEYQDCKTKFADINNLISQFGNSKNIHNITLDDGAYIQFPDTYMNIANAPHNWTYVYLQNRLDMTNSKLPNLSSNPYTFQPIKHSIYSCKEGYELIKPLNPLESKYKEIVMIEKYLDFCVAYYNTYVSQYDLLTNTNNLSRRYIEHRKGIHDTNLIKDYTTYNDEYKKFKNFIDDKISYFIMSVYNDYSSDPNTNTYVENVLLLGYLDDTTFNSHFQITDYYTDSSKNNANNSFKIEYNNNTNYSIQIDKLNADIDLLNQPQNLYDFLVKKNMNSYFKRI